jgi:hypothetical protein
LFDLANMLLADGLPRQEQLDKPDPMYPLELAIRSDCASVQNLDSVPPEELYQREYPNYSSVSKEGAA